MRKIIIDCDPGVDDAFAIAIANLDPQVDVLAIHTVSGNVNIENTTRNAQGLAHVIGYDGPIHKGAGAPLVVAPFDASEVHGHNGFGGVECPGHKPLSEQSAFESAVELLQTHDKVTYVALGPLTNLAILLKAHPELAEKIDCISLMGGGIKGGNTTIAGEFNFYADPHAAHIVFESGIPIIMAGLDVTERGYIDVKDIELIRDEGGELGQLLYDISQVSFKFAKDYLGQEKIHLHDAMSVLVLNHPDLFESEDYYIRISTDENFMRGMSMADRRPRSHDKPNTKVLLDVNNDRFRKILTDRLTGKETHNA